jgi:hypothetical protein
MIEQDDERLGFTHTLHTPLTEFVETPRERIIREMATQFMAALIVGGTFPTSKLKAEVAVGNARVLMDLLDAERGR